MATTSIGNTKTPSRPVEITFAAETGTPTDDQELLLIGHEAATPGTVDEYVVQNINNAGDSVAAFAEAEGYFGTGSELAKMVKAAIEANAGGSNFPIIKCIGLPNAVTDFGPSDEALVAAEGTKHEFIVSPYDGKTTAITDKAIDHALKVSGAFRVENNQFGTIAVACNMDVADPSTLPTYDTQFFCGIYLRDEDGADHPKSEAEVAAMAAAKMASLRVPFYPLDKVTIAKLEAPSSVVDHISVGQNLESDVVLGRGWTPLFVKPNNDVAFVRTVTSRLSVDGTGSPVVGAYYDVQDFQVLYFWRKTVYTRGSQPDFANVKASARKAQDFKSELIRLALLFQEQEMFQAVEQLSKKFIVERASSDRHRFDCKTPVNVIPGLHVIATNVEATTEFDELVI